jgi:hypothetical protein
MRPSANPDEYEFTITQALYQCTITLQTDEELLKAYEK